VLILSAVTSSRKACTAAIEKVSAGLIVYCDARGSFEGDGVNRASHKLGSLISMKEIGRYRAQIPVPESGMDPTGY
jgi:hypothetical protein